MLSHPSALLLDMDGTLFSSESLYKRIWQSAAQACSLSLSDAFYARHFIGHSFNTCLDAVQGLAGEDFDMKRFLRQLAACEKEARASPAKPGSRALLDWAGLAWPGSPPRDLIAVAARVRDQRFGEAIMALDRALWSGRDTGWNGRSMAALLPRELGPPPSSRLRVADNRLPSLHPA